MVPGITAGTLLQYGIKELEQVGIVEARTDTTQLLCFCLSLSRTELYLAADHHVAPELERLFMDLLARRKEREPLAYITGEREFWSLPFLVSPDVLIPRPETEFMLETVLAQRNRRHAPSCLDMCCGSGVIGIVLARELQLSVAAVDISFPAIAVARQNSKRHGVSDRLSFVQADMFGAFKKNHPFSLIVSNPPYVKKSDIQSSLEPEVSRHEPFMALNGGDDGLNMVRKIIKNLPDSLSAGGDCFIEIGDGQGQVVRSMALDSSDAHWYEYVNLYEDYSGRDRVIHVRRKDT